MIRPILFNTEMVQAILEGRKTTTRRIIKGANRNCYFLGSNKQNTKVSFARTTTILPLRVKIPYQVGDILYVRETWMIQSMKNFEKNIKFLYKAVPQELKEVHVSNQRYEDMLKFESKNGWQPSLFMPKEAARIFLKVTGVRVEKLQDITEEGAKAEGAYKLAQSNPTKCVENKDVDNGSYLNGFKRVWFKTLPKYYKDYATFEGNPYVWVIEFQRVERPKDFIKGGDNE